MYFPYLTLVRLPSVRGQQQQLPIKTTATSQTPSAIGKGSDGWVMVTKVVPFMSIRIHTAMDLGGVRNCP